jgi:hypothetical protein
MHAISLIPEEFPPQQEKKTSLKLQRLKYVGFLFIITSKYTRKYIRLIMFNKTFITNLSNERINDNV